MARTDEIQKVISKALEGADVKVLDPRDDGMHLEAIVIAKQFEGMPLLKQHKIVMQALNDRFQDASLHALQLKTYTPNQWKEQGEENNVS